MSKPDRDVIADLLKEMWPLHCETPPSFRFADASADLRVRMATELLVGTGKGVCSNTNCDPKELGAAIIEAQRQHLADDEVP